MTLIKQESHLLTCDSCGYEMQIDGKFNYPKGWYDYGLVYDYCPDCFIIDQNDVVVIKDKEDNNE
jgi:hypothetical protein